MERPHQQVRVHLTPEQQEQFKRATGKDGDEIELTVEVLEDRIAPKLARSQRNAAGRPVALGVSIAGDAADLAELGLAATLNVRGLQCKAAARFDEGRALYQRTLALLQNTRDPDQDSVATLYHNLGGIEHACGNYAGGEAFARRGLAIRRNLAGADPRDIAADLVALAAILDGQEKYAEAEDLYFEALCVFERVPDANVGEIAVALNDLGAQYARRGQLERAEELLHRAASLKKQALGPRHPDLAVTLNNLAVTRKRRGAFAAAATYYAEAIEIFEQSLGADHPKAVTCRANAIRCAGHPARLRSPNRAPPGHARVSGFPPGLRFPHSAASCRPPGRVLHARRGRSEGPLSQRRSPSMFATVSWGSHPSHA